MNNKPGIFQMYSNAFRVLAKKPIKLWGISLLSGVLVCVAFFAFGILPIVGLCVALLLQVAMMMIYLAGYRGKDEEMHAVNLFDCMKDWQTAKRVLCGVLWADLWIFLWSLIPIVGPIFAIIRTYEYRFTPYILMTQPEVKQSEAYKVSKQQTEGLKGTMFGADIIICLLVAAVFLVLSLLGLIPYIGVLFRIVLFIFYILVALFLPLFIGIVQAGFYDEANGRPFYDPKPVAPQAPVAPQFSTQQPMPNEMYNQPPMANQYPQAPAPQAPVQAPVQPVAQANICSRCGSQVANGEVFCSNCGNKL